MSREIVRDAIIYLPAKVIPALTGVISIPILTRLLSPEKYGQYLIAISSLTLLSSLCISWIVSIIIRYHVIHGVAILHDFSRRLLVYSIFIACVLWTLFTVFFNNTLSGNYLYIAGVMWLISNGLFEYYSGWLRARNFAKNYSISLSWKSLASLLGSLGFIFLGYNRGDGVIFGAVIAIFLALLILPKCAVRKEQSIPQSSSNILSTKSILRYGLPAAFTNFSIIALSLNDRYIIKMLLGEDFVGIYGANYDLAEKTIFFANSLLLLSSSVIGFKIFEKEGETKASNFLSKLLRLYIIFALPLVFAISILSQILLPILLPSKYSQGFIVFPIIAFSGLLVGIMHRYALLLSFHKRTDYILISSIIALVANIISCIFLIPKFGLIGAAIGTLIAYTCWLIIIKKFASKFLCPVFPWRTLICAIISLAPMSFVMITLIKIVNNGIIALFLSGFFGLSIYFISLICLKEIKKTEIQSLKHVLRNRS